MFHKKKNQPNIQYTIQAHQNQVQQACFRRHYSIVTGLFMPFENIYVLFDIQLNVVFHRSVSIKADLTTIHIILSVHTKTQFLYGKRSINLYLSMDKRVGTLVFNYIKR